VHLKVEVSGVTIPMLDAKLFLNVLNANWTKFHDADAIPERGR
jgi:hypothetical protein